MFNLYLIQQDLELSQLQGLPNTYRRDYFQSSQTFANIAHWLQPLFTLHVFRLPPKQVRGSRYSSVGLCLVLCDERRDEPYLNLGIDFPFFPLPFLVSFGPRPVERRVSLYLSFFPTQREQIVS